MKRTLIASAIAALLSGGAFAAEKADQPRPSSSAKDSPAMSQSGSAQGSQKAGQSAAGSQGAQGQQAQSMSSDVVKKAQQALKDKGHDAGPVDGQYGPLTAQGVKKFQEAEKLKVTGRLDQQTLSALGVDAQGASATGSGKAGQKNDSGSAAGSGQKSGTSGSSSASSPKSSKEKDSK